METISRLIYPAHSLAISLKVIKEIKKLNFNFIWKDKDHYIRKSDLLKNSEECVIKATDLETIWHQSFLRKMKSCGSPSLVFI